MNRSGKAPGACEKHQKKNRLNREGRGERGLFSMKTEWVDISLLLATLFLGSPVHANMPGIIIFSTDGDTAYNNAANPDYKEILLDSLLDPIYDHPSEKGISPVDPGSTNLLLFACGLFGLVTVRRRKVTIVR